MLLFSSSGNLIRTTMFASIVFILALGSQGAEPSIVFPFETGDEVISMNNIDILVSCQVFNVG